MSHANAYSRGAHRMQHRRKHQSRTLMVVALVCIIGGFLPLVGILIIQGINSTNQEQQATTVERQAQAWPAADQKSMVEQAQAYNRRLAKSGQSHIGATESEDGEADYTGKADREYMSLLTGAQGVMGTIRIPKIGVALPIRHGSGNDALNNGAGHLYGTSLPVGGKSTHTVITAHRGVPDKELFTRLDELHKGDVFYLNVAGGTLAYKVIRVQETDPSDTSHVRIEQGKDLATLLTCTPYGVNTRRMLVTGKRVAMPDDAPYVEDAPKDRKPMLVGISATLIVMFVGCSLIPPEKYIHGLHRKGFTY